MKKEEETGAELKEIAGRKIAVVWMLQTSLAPPRNSARGKKKLLLLQPRIQAKRLRDQHHLQLQSVRVNP